jgi:porin
MSDLSRIVAILLPAIPFGAIPIAARAQTAPPEQATGAAPEARTTSPQEGATTADPALGGRGEAPSGRDAAGAFSPGNAAAPAAEQSATAGPIARWQKANPLGKALRDLKADGVAITANYVGNFAANPVGGVRQGTAESHWFDAGVELDLDKLLGLSGATLHIQGAAFGGTSLASTSIGNSISFQQTWRPVPGPRLTQFNIDKDFFGKKLNIMVGRAALNSYFAASPLNCVFMSNTSCLTAYGPITAIGITAFPNSSWAAKAKWAFSKKVYAQVGVFDYDNTLNLHGKGGLDLSLFKGTGILTAAETGYETTFANDDRPRRYRAGVYINTDGGTNPLYDNSGNSSVLSGLVRHQQGGARVGVYAIGDQTVSRPDPRSQRNLAVFGRVFYNVGQPGPIDWFASGGFVKTGTFAGRDNDTLGVLVTNTHFSRDEVTYLRQLRAKAGGSGTAPRNEIIGEFNYGFAAMPGVRLLPNVQYVINPDPINATSFKRDIPSAIVVGLRVDIRLAQLLTGG